MGQLAPSVCLSTWWGTGGKAALVVGAADRQARLGHSPPCRGLIRSIRTFSF